MSNLSRRDLLGGAAAVAGLAGQVRAGALPPPPVVETNCHIFPADRQRFPLHPNTSYDPGSTPLDAYVKFAKGAGIGPVVIVHPSPYQDDHSVLEYCFANEPSPGFFHGTCFFDPTDPKTPARMKDLVMRHRGRIKALRIFEERKASEPPTTTGNFRDRDFRHPVVRQVWKAASDLGIGIQMVPSPSQAPLIYGYAAEFKDVPVIIDHLAAPQKGTAQEYEDVLKLGRLQNTIMKFTSVRGASKEEFPHRDLEPLAKRLYGAFGPDRMMWGTLGNNMEAYQRNITIFDQAFDFAPEAGRAKIRGLTALKVFGFKNVVA
jgi:predicted TIM-barrel fold metal-dependent hydrolase